jgi:hypothetical protein
MQNDHGQAKTVEANIFYSFTALNIEVIDTTKSKLNIVDNFDLEFIDNEVLRNECVSLMKFNKGKENTQFDSLTNIFQELKYLTEDFELFQEANSIIGRAVAGGLCDTSDYLDIIYYILKYKSDLFFSDKWFNKKASCYVSEGLFGDLLKLEAFASIIDQLRTQSSDDVFPITDDGYYAYIKVPTALIESLLLNEQLIQQHMDSNQMFFILLNECVKAENSLIIIKHD